MEIFGHVVSFVILMINDLKDFPLLVNILKNSINQNKWAWRHNYVFYDTQQKLIPNFQNKL